MAQQCLNQRLSTNFGETWFEQNILLDSAFFSFCCCPCTFSHLAAQGKPGCRNVKLGGDTVVPKLNSAKQHYMVYVVYRSFKFPPDVRK